MLQRKVLDGRKNERVGLEGIEYVREGLRG